MSGSLAKSNNVTACHGEKVSLLSRLLKSEAASGQSPRGTKYDESMINGIDETNPLEPSVSAPEVPEDSVTDTDDHSGTESGLAA